MKRGLLFLFIPVLLLVGCSAGAESTIVRETDAWKQLDEMLAAIVTTIPDNWNIPSLEENHDMCAGKLFSMEDFSSLIPGVSTFKDIDKITPNYPFTPYSVGNVYQYPAADGCFIYIVCADTIQAIYLDSSAEFAGTIEFLNMMDNPSLRPSVGRWK